MSRPEHVALLRSSSANDLNSWRAKYPGTQLDCSGADLQNRTFPKWNLSGVNFSSANLSGTIFDRANCQGADFSGAHLTNCNFHSADCKGANFSKAIFKGGRFDGADFGGALLAEADAREATFSGAQFAEAKLRLARFEKSNLEQAKLEGLDLRSVTLEGTKLDQSQLKDSNLSGLKVKGIQLSRADLTGADLSNANFFRGNFSQAKLSGASFDRTLLQRCDFANARLVSASFRDADLTRAVLVEADASEADFRKANFYEANLAKCNFDRAKGLHAARNLETTDIPPAGEREKYFERVELPLAEKYVSWERIRFLGRLPMFAASYVALIAIPFLYYLLDAYNGRVDEARKWAAKAAKVAPKDSSQETAAQFVLDHVHREPIPDLSWLLLGSTIFLAIGASIFATCPSRIREFSRDQWTDEFNRSLAHYWAMSWKRRWARFACIFFYVMGAVGAGIVLVTKLWNVGRFIVQNW